MQDVLDVMDRDEEVVDVSTPFSTTDQVQFQRFVILGHRSMPNYGDRPTQQVHDMLRAAISAQPQPCVNFITNASIQGRSIKPTYPIYALAVALTDNRAKFYAASPEVFNRVVRTGAHLLLLVSFLDTMRSWGRVVRRAISNWYIDKDPDKLAMQVLKYANRSGWTHMDVLRQAHPRPNQHTDGVFRFLKSGVVPLGVQTFEDYEAVRGATQPNDKILALLETGRIPWEFLSTELLANDDVNRVLARVYPYGALIRNLRRLQGRGVSVDPHRIVDEVAIRQSRMHPLILLRTAYLLGQSSQYFPLLMHAAETAMGSESGFDPFVSGVDLCIDVSGSMHTNIPGLQLSALNGVAYFAYMLARRNANIRVLSFANSARVINPPSTFTSAHEYVGYVDDQPAGYTDLTSVLKLYAWGDLPTPEQGFVFMTDNEVNCGNLKVSLEQLRKRNPDLKFAVMATTLNQFSTVPPDDEKCLDIPGFDVDSLRAVKELFNARSWNALYSLGFLNVDLAQQQDPLDMAIE